MGIQLSGLDFRKLQEAQQHHDEVAHKDILALSAPRRLTHFTLHFAKYAGALAAAAHKSDRTAMSRILTDSLIIALAGANSLDICLDPITGCESELYAIRPNDCATVGSALIQYVEIVGEMAKACESFDHAAERYPSYDVLKRALTKLIGLTLLCAEHEGVELACTIPNRWQSVEAKARPGSDDAGKTRQASVSAAA